MSLEPSHPEHDSPRDARRPSAINADGTLVYTCQKCLQHKTRDQFGANEHGRVNALCQDCERLTAAGVQSRRYMKDRSHITVTHKTCRMCGQERPSLEFWLDGKNADGLKDVCGDCERRRRHYRSAPPLPQYDSWTPASALQPVLDQAIAERDQLAAELERVRDTLDAQHQSAQNQGPRTDLLALHAIEDELRRVAVRLEALQPQKRPAPRLVRKGLCRVAEVVGPAASKLVAWADRQVDAHEDT